MNSDESFIIFRRFGRLSTRLLLHLQIELVLLQKKLDALDNRDNADPIMHWRLRGGTNFKGYDEEHLELLEEIRKAYLNYAEVLEKDVALRRLDKSTTRDHRSLFNWVRTMNPLCGDLDKAGFITRFDDFVSLSQQSQSTRRFEDFIQRLLGDGPPSRLKIDRAWDVMPLHSSTGWCMEGKDDKQVRYRLETFPISPE
ncbi:hypothetical protein HYALB_00000784 [Hymenoscyphus albidus]|uniref:DUF6594 domain-containing protein n=1 Tax=Hymenoscyphus albidus TaxID=595503 RepID=A0A9N9LV73_9HELO|nr:hypothetical protein HYALB_00000784 [Hymenoscyphus albidus]